METASVLIVDDDDNIRELYASAFKIKGFTILKAKNGQEGVTLALEHHPNIILMDIIMPEMDGHEAIKKIRIGEWGWNAKIMYLTNLSDIENVVHAVELKSSEYIVKSNTDVKEIVNRAQAIMYSVS